MSIIDRKFGEEFFQLANTPSGKYKNLCYWVGLLGNGDSWKAIEAREFHHPLSVQFEVEMQVWEAQQDCLGDRAFLQTNGFELFCPVQCAGAWSPFPLFCEIFGAPTRITQSVSRKPMAACFWDADRKICAFPAREDPDPEKKILRRALEIARFVAEQKKGFFLFGMPGWSRQSTDLHFPPHTRNILRDRGFAFADRV